MSLQVKPNHFLVDAQGKPEAVILSIIDYRKLTRLVDDLQDAAALKRAIRTSRGTIPHAKLIESLKKQQLL